MPFRRLEPLKNRLNSGEIAPNGAAEAGETPAPPIVQTFLLLLTVTLGFFSSAALAQPADLILHNGRIWTVNDDDPRAHAVAIRDGRFITVGSDEEALAHRGPGTKVIDLQERFALPGFIDSHIHFGSAAAFHEFNIMRVRTQAEFVERLRDVVSRLEAGEWIRGGFWGAYDQWAEGSAGDAASEPFTPRVTAQVDRITTDNPMFIQRFDRSAYAVNRAAMRAAGLDPEDPQAPDVVFERDESGRATGVVRGAGARAFFARHAPQEVSRDRRVQRTRNALERIARAGVTTVDDMSDDEQLEIYRDLRDSGDLTCRVRFRYTLDRWEEVASKGVHIGSGDAWIRLGCLKGFVDGIMGTSSARFFEPYEHDPGERGSWRDMMTTDDGAYAPEKFLAMMVGADRAGLQLSIHAIGDEANHVLLNLLERLREINGAKDRRFRLVHAQVIAPDDFHRLGELDVVAEVQPFHLSDDMRWMEERIGHERSKGAYAFRTINDSGATLAFGSDWPGTSASEYPINPLLGIYAAATRQTLTGDPPGGWFPDERISVEEAIRAYTINNAYANFDEDELGSIEVGKLADMTVLSENILDVPPRRLLETEAVYTIVDGEIVYARDGDD